jgi:hypothetical protein
MIELKHRTKSLQKNVKQKKILGTAIMHLISISRSSLLEASPVSDVSRPIQDWYNFKSKKSEGRACFGRCSLVYRGDRTFGTLAVLILGK